MKFLFPEDERVEMRRASLETFCIVDYFNRGKILNVLLLVNTRERNWKIKIQSCLTYIKDITIFHGWRSMNRRLRLRLCNCNYDNEWFILLFIDTTECAYYYYTYIMHNDRYYSSLLHRFIMQTLYHFYTPKICIVANRTCYFLIPLL